MSRCAYSIALAAVLAAAPAAADERVAVLDPDETSVTFFLDSTLHEVNGSMQLVSGEIRFDPETRTASGEVRLDARSTETGNKRRDRKMHKTVLESEDYPQIVFVPGRIEGRWSDTGKSTLRLSGNVTIHGGTHPLSARITTESRGDRINAVARFEIPFVEWGMEDPSGFFLKVDKVIQVTIETSWINRPATVVP